MPLKANFRLTAATGSFEDDWYKRVIMYAPKEEAIAIIAMDPRDAFYEIKLKKAQWKTSSLERTALLESAEIADMETVKNLPGLVSFAEYTAFEPFIKKWQENYGQGNNQFIPGEPGRPQGIPG